MRTKDERDEMAWAGGGGGGSAGMCIYYDLWCRVCTTTYNPVSVPRKHRGEGGLRPPPTTKFGVGLSWLQP